ncbi:hypothetical protein BS47DRAFT_1302272 [Hydnum rufescens UP504]|uniref:Uncharacterized protein n=1 Tax=Hydnum rufescens UP504 TaxID=1448309 RepID=A0A9P6DRV7_9AGAM|nr:hypothetical protein BS47DRAFT_1302272 [Hydnum rufescens UP504]
MSILLNLYIAGLKGNVDTNTTAVWTQTSLIAAKAAGKGPWLARCMRKWTRAFILDRNALPVNIYGQWNISALADEDLASEIHLHLQSKGKFVAAIDIVHYLDTEEVKSRFGLRKTIHVVTAQRWMKVMQYRWQKQPQGQYADGHERADVVAYCQNRFLPFWERLLPSLREWDMDGNEIMDRAADRRTVIWTHDESTFYAHDRRKLRWVHDSENPRPMQKGEGASLMVSDFASADYGWLCSPDGSDASRVLFKAGKNRDGYFTNDDIVAQAAHAMDILDKYYPHESHIFAFDNATTHLKRPDDALSASKMPKAMPKAPRNFLVNITVHDAAGKAITDASGNVVKEKQRMRDGKLPDGSPQPFYFPLGHQYCGQFKGMATILEERGINTQSLNAQCPKFKCRDHVLLPGSQPCCCRKALFDQPDFTNQKSRLEELGDKYGYGVIFYPRFHCECNFIENNWGYSKRIYRQYPESSNEKELERNVISALESVPILSMRRFFTRSLRFMDAYRKGLNGVQAAWANKKYRGHRVLPDTLMDDLDKET